MMSRKTEKRLAALRKDQDLAFAEAEANDRQRAARMRAPAKIAPRGDARSIKEAIQLMLDTLAPSKAQNCWGNGKRVRTIDANLLSFAEETLSNAARLLK